MALSEASKDGEIKKLFLKHILKNNEEAYNTSIDTIKADIKIKSNIPEDVDDILHYINAFNYGIKRI